MILRKIISGGQTGVDQAALEAAEEFGLDRGGWMPHGFITQDGPRSDFASRHGLQELPPCSDGSNGYRARTFKNVMKSGMTLRLAVDWDSAGERCTVSAIKKYEKPWLDVTVSRPDNNVLFIADHPRAVARELSSYQMRIINVAGNSERTAPGIQRIAKIYLLEVFRELKKL